MWRFALAPILLTCSTAFGQAFNIDAGGNLSTPPDSSYGGAAAQPGYWNAAGYGTLRGLDGQLTMVQGGVGGGSIVFEIPGATGDDEKLMESAVALDASQAAAGMVGLLPGDYDLYVYCWGGSLLGGQTVRFFLGNGQDTFTGGVSFGETWPGGQVFGETYDRMRFTILPGENYFTMYLGGFPGDFTVLNGLQLVPVPAPPGASAAMMALGALCQRRRTGAEGRGAR